jgi:hypothetical protein
MTDFIYLIWHKGGKMPEMPPEEMEKMMQEWTTWIEGLTKDGHFKEGNPFEMEGKIVHGPDKTVTDGTCGEGKGSVVGYLIIPAKDINEAVELSKGCPALKGDGVIEIRQIKPM